MTEDVPGGTVDPHYFRCSRPITGTTEKYSNQLLSHWAAIGRIDTVIPTVTKEKLPALLAYPVGAQLVTDALSSVPQVDDLELWFTSNRYGESEVDGKRLVFAARYQKYNLGRSASRALDESGFYGPKWDVWVYAVPKQLNSSIRSSLTEDGFEFIRDWFSQPRTKLWLSTSHECRLWYSPDDERLIAIADDN